MCLGNPLSFNDKCLILRYIIFHLGMKTLIYQTLAAGVVGRGSGWQKWDVSHLSPTEPSSTRLPLFCLFPPLCWFVRGSELGLNRQTKTLVWPKGEENIAALSGLHFCGVTVQTFLDTPCHQRIYKLLRSKFKVPTVILFYSSVL